MIINRSSNGLFSCVFAFSKPVQNPSVAIAIDEEDGLPSSTNADGSNGSAAAAASAAAARTGSKRSHEANEEEEDEELVLCEPSPDPQAAASPNKRARIAETQSDEASADASGTTTPKTSTEATPTFKVLGSVFSLCYVNTRNSYFICCSQETSYLSIEELFARKLSGDKGRQRVISTRRHNDYHPGIFYVLLCMRSVVPGLRY